MFKRPSASMFLVESLLGALDAAGIARSRLFERLELDDDVLKEHGCRVPLAALQVLWPWLREVWGHEAVGLRLARHVRPETWGVFGEALKTSVNLGDALVRAGRFIPLLVEGVELQLEVRGERAMLVYRGWTPTTCHPDSVEFALGVIVRVARQLGASPLALDGVRFAHGAPDDLRLHREVFGGHLEFGRAHNALIVRPEVLHLRIPGHDLAACANAEREVQRRLAGLPRAESVVRRTEETLMRELSSGNPTVERVADSLGMRSRTLSRRLRAEGSTFQEVLDTLRHGLADRYLSEGHMSITEVAYALGYSDPSAFNKAFRRWTGRAPQEYRRQAT